MKITFYSFNVHINLTTVHNRPFIQIIILLLFSLPSLVLGQTDTLSGKSVELVIQASKDFDLSADTNSIHWKSPTWIVLQQRTENEVAYQTKVKLQYSPTGLYCLYWCEDRIVTATIKEDFANIFNEDVVEIFLWTDESVPLYFEYELSPLNYELPILVPHLGNRMQGWLPWHYEGDRKTKHRTRVLADRSWVAEFFIPYKLLQPLGNVPPQHGTRWRANIYRIDYDKGQTLWTWQPIKNNFHDFQMYGTFVFGQ